MDYSLLVGVHFCDDVSAAKMRFSSPSKFDNLGEFAVSVWKMQPSNIFSNSPPFFLSEISGKRASLQGGGVMSEFPFSASDWKDLDRIADVRYVMPFNSLTLLSYN